MAGKFSIEAIFRAIDKFSAPVGRMQSKLDKFGRAASVRMGRLNKTVDGVNSKLKSVGTTGLVAGAALTAGFAKIIALGSEFEQTLVNAAAKFPEGIRKGSEAFAELEAAAKKVGAETEFTASQAANGLNFLAMAGFNAKQSVAALPGLVDLATAAQMDLAEASDIATDTLGAFGLATTDAAQLATNLTRVNDVLAKTANSSNTSISQLFESLKEGGPVAKAAGASIETYAAMAGKLANAGIKASVSGTTLKNVFVRLAAPVPAAAKQLDRFGIKTKDANGNLRDVMDVIGELNVAMKDLGTGDRTEVLNAIFGKIPIAGVNVLLAEGAESLKKYRGELEAAGGTAKTMASVMRDTTWNAMKTFQSTLEDVGLSVFEVAQGPFTELVNATTEFMRANKGAITESFKTGITWVKDNLSTIVFWAKAVGVALLAWGAANIVISGVTTAVTLFNGAVTISKGVVAGAALAKKGYVAGMIAVKAANWGAVASFAAIKLSIGGIAIAAGAAALAIGGIWAAWKANDSLKKKTGGLGVGGIIGEMWDQGTWDPAKAVDEHQNRLARADAINRNAAASVEQDVLGKYTVAPIEIPGIDLLKSVDPIVIPGDKLADQITVTPVSVPMPQVVSPSERAAKSITESHQTMTDRSEVVVSPAKGANVQFKDKPKRGGVRLQPTGSL